MKRLTGPKIGQSRCVGPILTILWCIVVTLLSLKIQKFNKKFTKKKHLKSQKNKNENENK